METVRSIIFDCDNTMGLPFKEIDDGLTLIYLLSRPELRLLGVTTTFGNGTGEQAYVQTKELLQRLNRADIPIWRGANGPGEASNPAARFMAEAAAAQPGKVTVLATGPLTNLCAAARLSDSFFSDLAEVACMGGILQPLQIGWRSLAELNLSADPQASHAVLNAACPVTLMSAQLCLQAGFGWGDLSKIGSLDPWLRITIRNWLAAFGLFCGVGKFYLWDLVPALYLSYPELFEQRARRVISTPGDLRSGKIIIGDPTVAGKPIQLPANIRDASRFKQIVINSWKQVMDRQLGG